MRMQPETTESTAQVHVQNVMLGVLLFKNVVKI